MVFNSLVFQNFGMMLEFQSRDKRSLNNYDAIEIKSKGFYASSVTIPYDQNLRSKLKLGSTLFSWLVWVVFLAMRKATALSGAFPYKHDGYANLGKSCHLCINSLPCHPSLIFGSNNDLCNDNYVARCGGRASRNEEDSKISQAVYCKCKPTALQQANCTEKVLENTRT